jgi:hypothetical protein
MLLHKLLRLDRLAWALVLASLLAGAVLPVQASSLPAPSQPGSGELEFFIGTADYPSHILLEWQSVSEQQTANFRLKRGTTPNPADATVITDPVIPAHPGSTIGYYYSYPDSAGLVPGVIYYYWIEDQDLGGAWNQHLDDPNLNPVVAWGCSTYDVVCDFVINTQDITALAQQWNCALGSPCYLPLYDVNADNVIDVRDMLLTASRWGCALGEACYP